MDVCVLGASGFIGRHLGAALEARGDSVTRGSLRDPLKAAELARGADVLVNLAGEPIAARRWTNDLKAKVRSSRVDATRDLLRALATYDDRPKTFVSASAIGYYGTSETATFTEKSEPGKDFLAQVCAGWEAEALRARELGMRVAVVRSGLVLGPDGGVLEKILPIFKSGGGGNVGGGKQWYSWIHIDDEVGVLLMAIDRGEGTYNATAPGPVRNAQFTQALAHAVHRPAIMHAPAFMLKTMFGEGAMVVLEGQHVLPERTLAAGYIFKYPKLDAALAEITR